MKKILILLSVFALAGCLSSFQLKKMGDAKMWGSYTVAVSEDVNELKTDKSILWTQDGPLLEVIEFWKPLSEGDAIPLAYLSGKADKAPKFRSDMTPEEVTEMVRSSFSLTKLVPTEMSNLRPRDFGTKNGYLVDLGLSSQTGDDFKSQILFTSEDGKLYAMYFNGRATHYYEARKPVFESIMASIQF